MKKCLLYLVLLLVGSLSAMAQTITGTVTSSSDGATLPGVSVIVKGTTTGTSTDASGKFAITVPNQQSVLVISFIGYSTQEITVGTRTTIDVQLQEDVTQLTEVVVTAIGIEREKKALGYAVSEVSGEDVSTVKDRNFASSLVGRVPGLVATQSSSGPGGGTRIIIRGNKSLGGNNQPLYVVDGIPIDNSGFGSADGPGTGEYARADYGTGLSDINPDDIASITVLKGPNAAALYGSRAANGVIMVTTKKGRVNQGLGISFSSNYTVETPLLLPTYQNTYGQGTNGTVPNDLATLKSSGSWGAVMDGSQQLYWTGEQRPYSPQSSNVEDFFEPGSTFINSVALDGGSDKFSTRFSYTNNQSKGIIPNSDLVKNNFSLRSVVNLTDKLSLDAKATVFYQSAKNRAVQGTEGIMANLYTIPRNTVLADLEDYQNESDFSVRSPTASGGNPYWVVNHDINEDKRSRVLGYAKLNYAFTDNLSAFVRIGTDAVRQKIETVNQPGHWFYSTGRFNYSDTHVSETNADFLLMFNKDITPDFQLDVNVGGNHRYQTFETQSLFGENFKIPTKATAASATILQPGYTPLREKEVNSLYGSAQIAFREIAYLDISARNDWSSTLPENNWSYFYPSASLSLLVNEFIDPNQSTLDFLKVRVGWAKVGNDTSPYQLTNAYDLQQNGYLGLTTLSRPATLYDENLKPEQISTYEIGFESKFLQNRIYADFSYYNIISKDLIWDVPITGSTGYTLFHTNVGQMTNKGFEFVIGGIPVKTADFSWDASLNFSKNTNSLDEIVGDLTSIPLSTTNSGSISVQGTVGGGYGDIYGTTYQRTSSGELIVDATGRPLATNERVYLGNYQPKWIAGFSNTLMYKNFSLRMLIDMRYGGQAYVGTDAGMDGSGVSEKTLQYREEGIIVDGVYNTGPPDNPTYAPNTNQITGQQYWGSYSGIASNYVYDQTNIRMRELTLIYNFPTSTLGNFIKGVSVGVVGRNLFFFSKKIDNFDPESSFSTSNTAQGVLFYNLPTTRSLGFNLNVKF